LEPDPALLADQQAAIAVPKRLGFNRACLATIGRTLWVLPPKRCYKHLDLEVGVPDNEFKAKASDLINSALLALTKADAPQESAIMIRILA